MPLPASHQFEVADVESLGKACKITLKQGENRFFAFLPRGINPPKVGNKLRGYFTGDDRAIKIPGYDFTYSRQAT